MLFGMRQKLSIRDVEKLLAQPTPQNKIETAAKIMAEAQNIKDDPVELALASDIICRLAADAEVAVRQAVAWQIAHSPLLTREVAEQLAHDVGSVAFPILRYAPLTDETLVEVLEGAEPRKALAVAGRKQLSARVSDAVINVGNVKAIAVLMGNTSATISTEALNVVLDKYGLITPVSNAMAHRADLSAEIVNRLVGLVSVGVRNYLIETHKLPTDQIDSLIRQGREAALVQMIQPIGDRVDQIEPFLRQLEERQQITPSFLFRALCAGELHIFRIGLAVHGRLPMLAIDELLRDRGPLGLPALMRRCEIPMSLLPAFKAALHVWRESDYNGEAIGRPAYQAGVLAAVFEDCTPIDDADLDHLLQNLFVIPEIGLDRQAE